MHTAVCTFADRDAAERAVERLLNAGFSRRDVHIQHREEEESPRSPSLLGVEREIAVGPEVVERIVGFFGDLFGREHPHRDTYSNHVRFGRCVVVVDAMHEPEADRARALMHDMKADHLDVVHRPAQRPLRDLLARTPAHVESPEAVQAAARGRNLDWTDRTAPARVEERAVAQGDTSQGTFDFGEVGRNGSSDAKSAGRTEKDDLDKVGLRYVDKGNRDK